jgi:hypothetical protein
VHTLLHTLVHTLRGGTRRFPSEIRHAVIRSVCHGAHLTHSPTVLLPIYRLGWRYELPGDFYGLASAAMAAVDGEAIR